MGSGDDPADTAARHLTREESRAVLDHHLALLYDLDDKAMWTVRTSVLLLALLASGAALVGIPSAAGFSAFVKISFALAILGLFVTIFVGLGAFFVSTTKFGVGAAHRREIRSTSYTEQEWLDVLLLGYDEWIQQMDRITDENARLVFRAQVLLSLSLAFLFIGISLLAIGT